MAKNPFEILVSQGEHCEQWADCENSPWHVGKARAKCISCRLAPGGAERGLTAQYWKNSQGKRHKVLVEEHVAAQRAKVDASYQKIQKRNQARPQQKVQQSARKAEADTNREILEASRNSGRIRGDGDALFDGRVLLDTKQQSKRLASGSQSGRAGQDPRAGPATQQAIWRPGAAQ